MQMRFGFTREKTTDNKTIALLKDVTMLDGEGVAVGPTFLLPKPLQPAVGHAKLMSIPRVKSAVEAMKNFRNLTITVDKVIGELYFDADLNGYYNNTWLDEKSEDSDKKLVKNENEKAGESTTAQLLAMITDLRKQINEKRKISPREAKNHMTIDEFSGADDGPEWMNRFEAECVRMEINTDADKIAILRALMTGGAKGWADSCEKRSVERHLFETWKESFIATYKKKNWTTVQKAYSYAYLGGSLTDYAIEKQRKLLNVDSTLSDRSMIDQIVVGMPNYARDKLDRDSVNTVNRLFEELAKIDVRKQTYGGQPQAKASNYKQPKEEKKSKSEPIDNRQTCSICRHLGLRDDRHLGKKCRFEDKLQSLPVHLTTKSEEEEIAALMNIEKN